MYSDMKIFTLRNEKSLRTHSGAIVEKRRCGVPFGCLFPVAVMREMKVSVPGREDSGMQTLEAYMEADGG